MKIRKVVLFTTLVFTVFFFTKLSVNFVKEKTFSPWIALCIGFLFLLLHLLKRSNSPFLVVSMTAMFLYFGYEVWISWFYIPQNPQNNFRGDLYILIPALLTLSIKALVDFLKSVQYKTLPHNTKN